MKKTYQLVHPKIKLARVVDSVKHDVKKYLKRERNKALPEGADYWDFACKFGATEATAEVVHYNEINKAIDKSQEQGLTSFYIEILAKPAVRKHSLYDEE